MKRLQWLWVAVALMGLGVPKARAVCRVLGPTEESGEHEVAFDSVTQALYVMAPHQLVGYRCRSLVAPPAGTNASLDPRPGYDFPVPVSDPPSFEPPYSPEVGAPEDVGRVPGGLEASLDRSRLLADGGVTTPPLPTCPDGEPPEPIYGPLVHTVIQPALYAMGGRGGLVMPLPARADVHVGEDDVFSAATGSTRGHVTETVTYIESGSVGYQCSDPHYSSNAFDALLGLPLTMTGCAMEGSAYYDPGLERRDTETVETGSGSVAVDRIATTENYDVVVLNAENLDALVEWLEANEFAYDDEDIAAFSHYVKEGAWFLAVHVEAPVIAGAQRVALAPLVVSWRGDEVPIMNRLQYSAAGGEVETDAFVMAPNRVAVEDGDGEVMFAAPADFADPAIRPFGLESGWVTRVHLTRRVDERKEDSRLVETPTDQADPPEIQRTRTVYIAQACCASGSIPYGGERSFTETYEYTSDEPSPAPEFYRAPPLTGAACQSASSYPTYYACSVDDGAGRPTSRPATRPSRLSMALSWLPLLAIVFGLRRRSRRRG